MPRWIFPHDHNNSRRLTVDLTQKEMCQRRFITAVLPVKAWHCSSWSSSLHWILKISYLCLTLIPLSLLTVLSCQNYLTGLVSCKILRLSLTPNYSWSNEELCHDLEADEVLRKWSTGRADVTVMDRITSVMGGGSWGLRDYDPTVQVRTHLLSHLSALPWFHSSCSRVGWLSQQIGTCKLQWMMDASYLPTPEEIWEFKQTAHGWKS